MKCRFCHSEKLVEVSAKCKDCCGIKMPGKDWASGYNFVPGLMTDGDSDYVTFAVCMACQRVQADLFEHNDKPKKGKKVWSLPEKLNDLAERTEDLAAVLSNRANSDLREILLRLAAVDRCLPGLVRDLERAKESPARTGKVLIKRSAASAAERTLAAAMPDNYELVD